MGMDAHRFLISWSQILPKGSVKGGINKEGIAYYNNLISELLNNGIKPFITIFHWDLPQALEDDYGGFLSSIIVKDFAAYAEVCFQAFGDRVKHWITLNEPWTYVTRGYDRGTHAPGRCSYYINGNCSARDSATEPYITAHNLLLCHAVVVNIYKTKEYIAQALPKGCICITLVSAWMLPYSETINDQRAAQRALDFKFMDPITRGDYPSTMRNLVDGRLPKLTKLQSRLLKGSYDFIGLNYYTSRYAADNPKPSLPLQTDYFKDSRVNLVSERNGVPIGQRVASPWLYVYPPGIKDLLNYTKNRHNNPLIFITENGKDRYFDFMYFNLSHMKV
eukprot:Gb_35940 [translate_table: standard]